MKNLQAEMFLFEAPVTRPLVTPRLTKVVVYLSATIIVILVIFINVIAVGYELVSFSSSSFNESAPYWYESFIPTNWRPVGRSCEPAVIKLKESVSFYAT
jgi:hypothetical protein